MRGYPVMLDLAKKDAVVIGGGKVATRKVLRLLTSSEANITVVSPEITDTLKHFVEKKAIVWHKKRYEPDDIKNAFIVIAATDDKELNRTIAKECKPYQLVNVVSEAKYGNFMIPASVRRGNFTISVSTDGLDPQMAKQVCNELASRFDKTFYSQICH